MIEVFKTNVETQEAATSICGSLCRRPGIVSVTFDLDDCDKILRVEGSEFDGNLIKNFIEKMGYECQVLI